MPPSITPEMSPTVSTAVTMNMISTGTMARRSKTRGTGISFGMENQEASATLSQFKTHALVYSTPSAVMPVGDKKRPMTADAMYPAMMPIRMDDALVMPFVPCLNAMITTVTRAPRARFSMEPKSAAVFPPPKELTPTDTRDRPMERTTVPVTTAGKNRLRGFNKKPRTVSNRPPRTEASIMAP